MSEEQADPRLGCLLGIGHWTAYAATLPPMFCVVSGLAGLWMVAMTGLDPAKMAEPGAAEALMTPGFIGATSLLQGAIMGGSALLLGLFLPRSPDAPGHGDHMVSAFAARAPTAVWIGAAVLATLTAGMLPGWIASRMMEAPAFESYVESMGLIAETLSKTDDPGWILMALAVGASAPLFEEIVFRGYLWRAAELAMPPVAVWLLTSVAFACFHGNPIHIVAVLPIGLLLGWLRWHSGSIWPAVLAHAVNNSLAIGITVMWSGSEDAPLPWSIAGFLFTLSIAASATAWARSRPTE